MTSQVAYPDALVLMEHLQAMGESNAVLSRRGHVSRDTFVAAAAIYKGMRACVCVCVCVSERGGGLLGKEGVCVYA
jgi:hypothetical protein